MHHAFFKHYRICWDGFQGLSQIIFPKTTPDSDREVKVKRVEEKGTSQIGIRRIQLKVK